MTILNPLAKNAATPTSIDTTAYPAVDPRVIILTLLDRVADLTARVIALEQAKTVVFTTQADALAAGQAGTLLQTQLAVVAGP